MKPAEQQQRILSFLRAMQKEFHVDQLASMLGVSHLTIRRDLDMLAAQRAVIRTHGGCIAASHAALETEYQKKVALNFELKQAIGRKAASLVEPNSTILMNDGSTTFHLATFLGDRGPLTVYTNSLSMITELNRHGNIRLYILAGEYNTELASLQGSLTEHVLQSLRFDLVFLGADSISERGRCLVSTPDEARLTQAMLQSGRKRVLLADHTKIDAHGHIAYGALQDFDVWVTTRGVAEPLLSEFRRQTTVEEAAYEHIH